MESVINLKNIVKNFGPVQALKNVNLDLKRGEMFGLVGPDGAGKTTIIRILCGIYKPDEGSSEVLGFDTIKEIKKIKNSIGYLSQKFSLYGDLTIDENLEFFAEIHGVKDYKQRREELLDFTRLKPFRDRFAEKLSGGMKQKLGLACTLIHEPQIIFLDEPTTGVDPVSRRDFWKILSNLLKSNITILITSPYLDEVERCNRVGLLNNGSIMMVDTPNNLKKLLTDSIIEIIPDNIRQSFKLLSSSGEFNDIQAFGDRLNVFTDSFEEGLVKITRILNENNINILHSRTIPASLENVFISMINQSNRKAS